MTNAPQGLRTVSTIVINKMNIIYKTHFNQVSPPSFEGHRLLEMFSCNLMWDCIFFINIQTWIKGIR